MSNVSTVIRAASAAVGCSAGDHVAGLAGAKAIRVNDWDAKVDAFAAKIDDFNIRGQRQQVDHPGFLTRYRYCTECGADLRGLSLKALDWSS